MSKKHKVKIPEGYEPGKVIYNMYRNNDGNDYYVAVKIELNRIEKELPKTWKEYYLSEGKACYWLMELDKYQDEFVALFKLILLRDHYNDGWEPDWNDCSLTKYSICNRSNGITRTNQLMTNHVLTFRTPELSNEFLSNFRELIETAKPLL